MARRGLVDITQLFVGLGVLLIILLVVGIVAGQMYAQAEPDINAINDTVVKTAVKGAVQSGFTAMQKGANYLPIYVIGIIGISLMALLIFYLRRGTGVVGGVQL